MSLRSALLLGARLPSAGLLSASLVGALPLASCASGDEASTSSTSGSTESGPSTGVDSGGGDASSSSKSSSSDSPASSTGDGGSSPSAGGSGPGNGGAGGTGQGGAGGGDAGGGGEGPLPYPTRTAMRLKGLQPDFWPNHDDVSGNNAGGVSMNLVWAFWEGSPTAPPCAADQEELDGHCFTVDANVDASIADYTARGVVVTAIVYGVPAWARTGHPCSPAAAGFDIFCSPDDAADYGRFARMLARRYDGRHGHGRIADFVIHNEVNSNTWFDIGCGQGTTCDTNAWLDVYAANYNAAYDGITAEQPSAKVLVSLEHHFGAAYDGDTGEDPNNETLSGETVLRGVIARAGVRTMRVAYHPYPPNLLAPAFGPDDWPRVTYGNLGILEQWLRRELPAQPASWEIHLTESGVNSLAPQSSAEAQADGVCRSLRNVLGTPGVESYIYHRMVDNPGETVAGLGLGLHDENSVAKPAWAVWALANRDDLVPPQLSCGFESLPYVKLDRSVSATRGHWASSRVAPATFSVESSYRLLRDAAPDTVMLYECAVGAHNLLTTDVNCEGLQMLGAVGYASTVAAAGTQPLYRCRVSNSDHFISPDPGCEGQIVEQLLAYVW